MKSQEAIKQLLKDNKKTQAWLAEQLGYAGQSAIGQMLHMGGNVTIDRLCRICETMGYEVSIQPARRAGKRPEGQIVLERSDK